jgi:hypothetical protein
MRKKLVPRKSVSSILSSPDDDKTHTIDTIIPIPRIIRKERKKCERCNYVPYSKPRYDNQNEWRYAYDFQIYDMYRIVGRMIEEKYPNLSIDWKDPQYYTAFNNLIYACSSKYITPYIEERDNDDNDNILSKDLLDDNKEGWVKQKRNS